MSDRNIQEAERLLTICSSCRYCEGYCAVFPAMERRINFTESDIDHLASLCHNCAECYYACQYAPPHEFAVNIPKVLAEIRSESYRKYARPKAVAAMFQSKGIVIAWVLAALCLAFSVADFSGRTFYAVFPHGRMIAIFLPVSLLIFAAHFAGFAAFWRETEGSLARFLNIGALVAAARDVLSMKYLGSGGAGCTYPDEHHSQARRIFHHFTFYGFASCFASTTVAAIYHFSGRIAPYPYLSLPVALGMAGGIGLLIGPAGLYILQRRRDQAIADPTRNTGDTAFIVLLFLTSLTGLLLLVLRGTPAMSTLLLVHLTIVLALFLTLPYGKFVHGIYRTAALVRHALEFPRPSGPHGSADSAPR